MNEQLSSYIENQPVTFVSYDTAFIPPFLSQAVCLGGIMDVQEEQLHAGN